MEKIRPFLKIPFPEAAAYLKLPVDTKPGKTELVAREQLLRAMKLYDPDFLPTLARDVLPSYKSAWEVGRGAFKGDLFSRFQIVMKSWRSLWISLEDLGPDDAKLHRSEEHTSELQS